MALSQNQLDTVWQKQLGRPSSPYEFSQYAGAPSTALANIKQTYGALNTNSSVADLAKSLGHDPSLQGRTALAGQYGMQGYTGTADQNQQLHDSLSGKTQPATPQPPQNASQGTITGATPQQEAVQQGSVQEAAQPMQAQQAPYQPPAEDPMIADTRAQYKQFQSKIHEIDMALSTALADKQKAISAGGGMVSNAELMGLIQLENAPLIAQRKELAYQQSSAGKDLQSMMAASRAQAQEAFQAASLNQKTQQFSQTQSTKNSEFNTNTAFKGADLGLKESNLALNQSKAASSDALNYAKLQETIARDTASAKKVMKVAQYDAFGQKVGEGIQTINTRGGSVSSAGGSSGGGSKSTKAITKALTASASGGFGSGIFSLSKAALDGMAKSLLQGAKLSDLVGGGNSKPVAALKLAILNRSYELNPSSDPALQQATYKAMTQSIEQLTKTANSQAGYENKAQLQIKMMTEGYQDKINNKRMPALLDAASTGDINVLNKLYQNYKIQTNNTPQVLLANALITFTTEYSKIMSGGTGSVSASSDTAQQHAMELINTGMKDQTLKDVLGQLSVEMDTTIKGNNDQIAQTTANMKQIGSGSSQSSDGGDYDSYLKAIN